MSSSSWISRGRQGHGLRGQILRTAGSRTAGSDLAFELQRQDLTPSPQVGGVWRLALPTNRLRPANGIKCGPAALALRRGRRSGVGGARRSRVAGQRGLPSHSCVRGRLRPAAFARLRCGARRPGLRREVIGVAGPYWPPTAQRRLALLGLASLGDPGHLRASPLPKSRDGNPRRPAQRRLLAWEKGQRSALAKASVNVRPVLPLRELALAIPARHRVAAGRPCSHAVNDDLARLRERTCLSLSRPSEER